MANVQVYNLSMLLLFLLSSAACICAANSARSNCSSKPKVNLSISDTLDELFKKPRYDSRIRPNINGSPVRIMTGFWVLSIDSVSVTDMAFGLDIFLRQDWVDERLDHGLNQTLSLSNTVLSHIWLPDTYFKNAKQSYFHEVTAKNIMIRIGPGGKVHYNSRITLKAACIMDLRLYPFDVQKCAVIMESYGYSVDHVMYEWETKQSDGMQFVPGDAKVLPQFKLTEVKLTKLYTQYVIGNWSGVVATFTFERTYSFYLIHIYGPSALIVMISWISFLLPHEQAPARVTLGVTSLLTEVTILTMSNQAIPRVNYVKSIDKYLITCFLFVFATLVEYALLLGIAGRQKRHRKAKQSSKTKENDQDECDKQHQMENGDIVLQQINSGNCMESNGTAFHRRVNKDYTVHDNLIADSNETTQKKKKHFGHNMARCIYRGEIISVIDRYSRRIFPTLFVLFNFYYWICVFYYPDLVAPISTPDVE